MSGENHAARIARPGSDLTGTLSSLVSFCVDYENESHTGIFGIIQYLFAFLGFRKHNVKYLFVSSGYVSSCEPLRRWLPCAMSGHDGVVDLSNAAAPAATGESRIGPGRATSEQPESESRNAAVQSLAPAAATVSRKCVFSSPNNSESLPDEGGSTADASASYSSPEALDTPNPLQSALSDTREASSRCVPQEKQRPSRLPAIARRLSLTRPGKPIELPATFSKADLKPKGIDRFIIHPDNRCKARIAPACPIYPHADFRSVHQSAVCF